MTITTKYDSILGINQDLNKVIGDMIKYFRAKAVQTLELMIWISRINQMTR
jgi:hypothetical protein